MADKQKKESPLVTYELVEADSRLIHWLLHDSGVSRYHISKALGISESTLSRIVSGETSMDALRFGYARKLTDYARSLQTPQEGSSEA